MSFLISILVIVVIALIFSPKMDRKFNGVWVKKKTKEDGGYHSLEESQNHTFSYFKNRAEYKINGKKIPLKFNKWIGLLVLNPNTSHSKVYLLKKGRNVIRAEGENEVSIFQKNN